VEVSCEGLNSAELLLEFLGEDSGLGVTDKVVVSLDQLCELLDIVLEFGRRLILEEGRLHFELLL